MAPNFGSPLTPKRPPYGRRRGGTTAEREGFVLEILRKNPNLPTMGKGGVSQQVAAKFGVGMRHGVVNRLRAKVLEEALKARVDGLQAGKPVRAAVIHDTPPGLEQAINEQANALFALVEARARVDFATRRVADLVAQATAAPVA